MAFSDFSRITRDVLYIAYNIIHDFAAVVIQFYDSRLISKLTNLPRSLQRVEPIFIRYIWLYYNRFCRKTAKRAHKISNPLIRDSKIISSTRLPAYEFFNT